MPTGTVTKLANWKNNLGFFIGIDGTDYMYLGDPKIKTGDRIDYELGDPARDGKPTIRSVISISDLFVKASDYKPEPAERNDVITRLACIKAACELLSNKNWQSEELAAIAIDIARKFERYSKEG